MALINIRTLFSAHILYFSSLVLLLGRSSPDCASRESEGRESFELKIYMAFLSVFIRNIFQ